MPDRLRVYLVEQTVTERYYYDPAEIKRDFADPWEAFEANGGTFDDFLIELFEEHNGSQFHDRYFSGDASPAVSVELIERWDDE